MQRVLTLASVSATFMLKKKIRSFLIMPIQRARIAASAQKHDSIWDGLLSNLSCVGNRITSEPEVYVDSVIAVSTLVGKTTFVSEDGREQRVPTFGTLVWQRTLQDWHIVHEHDTTLPNENGGASS